MLLCLKCSVRLVTSPHLQWSAFMVRPNNGSLNLSLPSSARNRRGVLGLRGLKSKKTRHLSSTLSGVLEGLSNSSGLSSQQSHVHPTHRLPTSSSDVLRTALSISFKCCLRKLHARWIGPKCGCLIQTPSAPAKHAASARPAPPPIGKSNKRDQ